LIEVSAVIFLIMNIIINKNATFLIYLLASILVVSCIKEPEFENIIERIRLNHAPDPREGVFDVSGEWQRRKEITLTGETDSEQLKNMVSDSLRLAGYIVRDSIKLLPVNVPWPWALVNLSTASIRSSPSHRAELVNQAVMGTPVKVLKESGGWVYLQTPDNYLGWCEKSSLSGMSDKDLIEWKNSPRVIFLNIYGFIRCRETDHNISDIVAGSILEKAGEEGDMTMVNLPDGRKGFIDKAEISCFDTWKNRVQPEADALTETAMTMKGIPYLWGGTSVKGFDCSGFTRTLFFLNGLIISRDASLQVRLGRNIPVTGNMGDLEPGDLLFFRSNPEGDDDSPVTHVGLYTGNSEYIHAAGMVRINSMDSSRQDYSAYRHATLQSARRIIKADPAVGVLPVSDHPWY
jgi:gamma-D-glutamyl-L-lysine dipeptidyl-peptidase